MGNRMPFSRRALRGSSWSMHTNIETRALEHMRVAVVLHSLERLRFTNSLAQMMMEHS